MPRNKLLIGLILLFIAQIAVPVSMISERETILEQGREFRFVTRPIDPTDYMRGKYVRLFMPTEPAIIRDTTQIPEELFAWLSTGRDGFARVDSLTANEPKDGDYLRVRMEYKRGNMVNFAFPFDRFYMEETKAPAAEDLYMKLPDSVTSFVKVRVLNGEAVIENVFVGGRPVGQLAAEHLMK